ncbi:hypothetical protein [Halorubrum vacuolatum]|uniref:DUF8159 domain-containing protein n=1 Tax=Halorubrum vacuolatum TaxID=63740 RepID=A0A238UQR9_HALVU|nr:hypothetical protein [Halorubrum vacuolatum]SNR23823.1 hypothetical protein SAMN06264855_101175 [Halorubrum vacuolatum]
MNRRRLLVAAATGMSLSMAGCADDEANDPDESAERDGEGSTANADSNAGSEVDAFHNAITVIDEELGVDASGIESEFVWVDFYTTGELVDDLQVVGGAYAAAVDQGVDRPLSAIAVQEDAPVEEYEVTIEPEWGQAFIDEELSGQEYLERIEETLE